jgi:hypothetical protein
LPKAIISGIFEIGTGYITILIKSVHEGNETRLTKLGKKLNLKIGGVLDMWIQFAKR